MKSIRESIFSIHELICLFFLTFPLLLIFSLSACGKRADPVLIPSMEEQTVEDRTTEGDASDQEEVEKEDEEEETEEAGGRRRREKEVGREKQKETE